MIEMGTFEADQKLTISTRSAGDEKMGAFCIWVVQPRQVMVHKNSWCEFV